MKILAVETSAKAVSCALAEDGRLVAEAFQNSGLTHSRTLLPMVEDMLKNCGLSPAGVDLFAAARGPGSFTGIRIGVAAVKGLAWATEKPCCGVSTLEAMAFCAPPVPGVVCAAMDARRSQVYAAVFAPGGERPARLTEDAALSLGELAEKLKNLQKACFLVGDGAELCYNYLSKNGLDVRLAPELFRFQRASGVALAAAGAERLCPGGLRPVYLRLSQAERERLERQDK